MNLVIPYFNKNLADKACVKIVKESVLHWKKVSGFGLYIYFRRKMKL